MGDEKEPRNARTMLVGAGWRLLLALFVVVGAWVTISRAYGWARPLLRYLTVASVAFTLGTMYGRHRRERRGGNRA